MTEHPAATTVIDPAPDRRASMTTVLVVDDHAPLRRLMADVLAEAGDIRIVGECSDGDEVVDAVLRTRPDVVLMDVRMQRTDGLEATRRLLAVEPQARVVLLSACPGTDAALEARRLGAKGYRSKGDTVDLAELVRSVARGGTLWTG